MRSAYGRGGFAVGALYGAMSVAESAAVIVIGVIVGIMAVHGGLTYSTNYSRQLQLMLEQIKDSGILLPAMAAFLVFTAIGTALGIVIMRKIVRKGSPIDKKNLSIGKFLLVALMCFGVWGVGALLGNLAELCGAEQTNIFSIESLGTAIIPYLIYAMVGAPILEELAFRKTLLDRLHDHGEGYAAVISALLFGLMHGNHMQFFLAFFLGLIFAMVYMRTGRVIYTMLLHAMINTTATLPELFALGGIDIDTPWYIAVGALMAAGLVVLIIMRKDPLLNTERCEIPDCNNAAYKNPGMLFARIAGLALIGLQGIALIFMPMITDKNPAHLIGLIPLTLAFLTVLLLPGFTKRYEAKPKGPIEYAEE